MKNSLRQWMNLCTTSLVESVIQLEMRYGVLPVWKNPTRRQLVTACAKFGIMRGMIDSNGDLYCWDASEATHDDVDEVLGLDTITHRFLMDETTVTTQYQDAESLTKLPALKRVYNNKPFEVITDLDQ